MNEAALQRLLDESDLRDLMQAVPRALDARDWDSYGEVFTEDAVFEILGQSRQGRAAIVAGPKGDLEALYEVTYHHMGQIYVDVEGDDATVVAYCVAYHLPKASDPTTHANAGGRYHAAARRTAHGWRFASMRVEVVLSWGIPFTL